MQFYKRNLCINWPFFGCHCFLFFLPSWIPKWPPGVHKMSPKWGRPHRRPKNAILQKELVYKLALFGKHFFYVFLALPPESPRRASKDTPNQLIRVVERLSTATPNASRSKHPSIFCFRRPLVRSLLQFLVSGRPRGCPK